MSHSALNQLKRAEQLFDTGKLDEALEIFDNRDQFEGLDLQQKLYFQYLKGLILVYQNKSKETIEWGEHILREGQEFKIKIQSFDGLYFIILGLALDNEFDKAFKKVEDIENLLGYFSNESKKLFYQLKIRVSVLKGFIGYFTGQIDLVEKTLEEPLYLEKEFEDLFEIVWANILMAQILMQIRRNVNPAMEYTKKAMKLAKKIKFNHYWIGLCHIGLGVIHSYKCEYGLCLKEHMKSLAIYKKINNNWYIAVILNNLGNLYCEKGDYDVALKYLEESLILWEQYSFQIETCIESLIFVCLEKGDYKLAQKYFQRLENMYHQRKTSFLELLYKFNKALILKRSSRIRDKAKAEELLKKVVATENINFDFIIYAYINLCDLLLTEFRINNDREVLEELNFYIARLLTLAEKIRSNLVFCETFILQAKLSLINFDLKAARRFLTQAQKISESYGIKRLEMKISHEHDELLRQLNIWERLKKSNAPLSERWKLAGLNEQMEKMVKKRIVDTPKISDETPISIFIITEGGTALLSHSFIDQKTFESHLFGGFLTTIDYFIREMFSEGLDRAIFGDYTLLMKSIPPFFVSYIFKGDSYYAIQKVNYFIEHIQKEEDIWPYLLKSFQVNQSIHLKEMPLLESLVTETFVTNKYK